MSKILLALVVLVILAVGAAPYIMNRYQLQMDDVIPSVLSSSPPRENAKQNGSMTTKQLLDLAKTDPRAFDAYVMEHINDLPPEKANVKGKTAGKTALMESNTVASGVDKTVMEFYMNHLDHSDHTTLEKMLNWLAHGKYE